jgi:hypothetical protein
MPVRRRHATAADIPGRLATGEFSGAHPFVDLSVQLDARLCLGGTGGKQAEHAGSNGSLGRGLKHAVHGWLHGLSCRINVKTGFGEGIASLDRTVLINVRYACKWLRAGPSLRIIFPDKNNFPYAVYSGLNTLRATNFYWLT